MALRIILYPRQSGRYLDSSHSPREIPACLKTFMSRSTLMASPRCELGMTTESSSLPSHRVLILEIGLRIPIFLMFVSALFLRQESAYSTTFTGSAETTIDAAPIDGIDLPVLSRKTIQSSRALIRLSLQASRVFPVAHTPLSSGISP